MIESWEQLGGKQKKCFTARVNKCVDRVTVDRVSNQKKTVWLYGRHGQENTWHGRRDTVKKKCWPCVDRARQGPRPETVQKTLYTVCFFDTVNLLTRSFFRPPPLSKGHRLNKMETVSSILRPFKKIRSTVCIFGLDRDRGVRHGPGFNHWCVPTKSCIWTPFGWLLWPLLSRSSVVSKERHLCT